MSQRICTARRTRGSSAGATAGIYSRARGVIPMVRSPDDERTDQYTRDKWSNPRSNTRTAGTIGGHEARHARVRGPVARVYDHWEVDGACEHASDGDRLRPAGAVLRNVDLAVGGLVVGAAVRRSITVRARAAGVRGRDHQPHLSRPRTAGTQKVVRERRSGTERGGV